MKYKLLQDLPFLKAGEIFGIGCWVGGGFGVDRGITRYEGGGSSHNGIRIFEKHENKILEDILNNKQWIEKIPDSEYEVFDLYDKKEIDLLRAILLLKQLFGIKR